MSEDAADVISANEVVSRIYRGEKRGKVVAGQLLVGNGAEGVNEASEMLEQIFVLDLKATSLAPTIAANLVFVLGACLQVLWKAGTELEAPEKVFEVELLLLQQIANSKKSHWTRSGRGVRQIERWLGLHEGQLLEQQVRLIRSKVSLAKLVSSGSAGMKFFGAAIQRLNMNEPARMIARKLLDELLESKVSIPPRVVDDLQPFLEEVQQSDFDESVRPKLESALKLRADALVDVISRVLKHLRGITLNGYVDDPFFLDGLCKALTSSAEQTRFGAVALSTSLGMRSRESPQMLLGILSSLVSTLSGHSSLGKQGIAHLYQREALVGAFDELAESLRGSKLDLSEIGPIVDFATSSMANYIKKENVGELRSFAICAGAHWIATGGLKEINPDFLDVVLEGVLLQPAIAREHIRGLAHLLATSSTYIQCKIANSMTDKISSPRRYESCISIEPGGSSLPVSQGTGSSSSGASKKGKKGKGISDLDSLEAEMLSLGGAKKKKKKASAPPSKALAAPAEKILARTNGILGVIFDVVLAGDALASSPIQFKQNHSLFLNALVILTVAFAEDENFAAKIPDADALFSFLFSTKKVWASMLVKIARTTNSILSEEKREGEMLIAGVDDNIDKDAKNISVSVPVHDVSEWRVNCIGKSPGEETQLMSAKLIEYLVKNGSPNQGDVKASSMPILQTALAALTLSPSFSVRSRALPIARTICLGEGPESRLGLTDGLLLYLSRVSAKVSVQSSVLRAVMKELLADGFSKDGRVLSNVFLLCHHPFLRREMILNLEKALRDSFGLILEQGVHEKLLALAFASSEDEAKSTILAAQRALSTIVSGLNISLRDIPGLWETLEECFNLERLQSFSDDDLLVFNTDPSRVSSVGLETLEAERKRSDRKSAGHTKVSGTSSKSTKHKTADEIWEEQVRADIQAKRASEQGSTMPHEAEPPENEYNSKRVAEILEQEQNLRNEMKSARCRALRSAAFVREFFNFDQTSGHRVISELCPVVFEAAAIPLISSDMDEVFRSMLQTDPGGTFDEYSSQLAASLRLALQRSQSNGSLVQIISACKLVSAEICGLEEDEGIVKALSPASFQLIFPILQSTITGMSANPMLLVLWATLTMDDDEEDDENDDDDENEQEASDNAAAAVGVECGSKKTKKKKKKEEYAEKNPKKKKTKKKESKKDAPIAEQERFVNPFADYMDMMESPLDSIERALAVVLLHASIVSREPRLREESVQALLRACEILPEAKPAPSEVLRAVSMPPPVLEGKRIFDTLLNDFGLLHESEVVRTAVLDALLATCSGETKLDTSTAHPLLVSRLWFSRFDDDEGVRERSQRMVTDLQVIFPEDFIHNYLDLLRHSSERIRNQAGRAFSHGVEIHPAVGKNVLKKMIGMYEAERQEELVEKEKLAKKKVMFIDRDAEAKQEEQRKRHTYPRHGSATTLLSCVLGDGEDGGAFGLEEARSTFDFICKIGLRDENDQVRQTFLEAGLAVVDSYGRHLIDELLAMLRPLMSGLGANEIEADWQREGSVIFVGALASFMEKEDERIPEIVSSLIESLQTPNEAVQLAATKCLPPLMKTNRVKDNVPHYINQLLIRASLLKNDSSEDAETDDVIFEPCHEEARQSSFAKRRGAALGLASVVKGLGIAILKRHRVVLRVEAAMRNDILEVRQGGLLCLEALCSTLGMLFEPYVIKLLPALLQCFADTKKSVRDAATDASRAIMAKLSGHGVKLVMPVLLKAMEDSAWRTKQAAIRMLGSMAFCAKKQLAACLPQVVPALVTSFTDSHPKVRTASGRALKEIGSVIQNPEIRALVPTLKKALMFPDTKTASCVEALHRTRFIHMVDAPSLALIVPVLDRGLNDRATETKKKAALITGNMCSMISDPRAVLPYVTDLLPVLRKVLVDPIPGVRSTAAKALGTLTSGLGKELPNFAELHHWLLETSRGDSSPVERSGGAQGLVEVSVAMGEEFMMRLLEEHIFPNANHSAPHFREGVAWVMVFLPPCLGREKNAKLIDRELPVIIAGLSDESELVRDVSMRSGQVIVEQHAIENTSELLPVLERGLDDEKWRIRQSSVHLLGDLLYRVGGSAEAVIAAQQAREAVVAVEDENDAEITDSEDEEMQREGEKRAVAKATKKATAIVDANFESNLKKALGSDRHEAILASVYLLRSDSSAVVRQSAVKVWKNLVVNTGRSLREILKPLMDKIVFGLSGAEDDKRMVAGRCLGDIVKKLGDRVLPDIIPIIEEGLKSDNASERAGIALGLIAIIHAASKRQLEKFAPNILPAVQLGLSDENEDVQEISAEAFAALYKQVGPMVVTQVVPSLLSSLETSGMENENGKRALAGLTKILSLRSKEIMPLLMPKILVSPMTCFHAEALAAICKTISPVLHFYVDKILAFLVTELAKHGGGPGGNNEKEQEHVWTAAQAMLKSVQQDGVAWLVPSLVSELADSKSAARKRVLVALIGEFCVCTTTDFDDFAAQIIKELIKRFSNIEDESTLLQESWNSFNALCKSITPEKMSVHQDFLRSMLKSVASDAKYRLKNDQARSDYTLPGLNLPKGLEPFLPIYQYALMNGTSVQRESAALGLGELIGLTSNASLRPFVIKITGPLIRIVGDRFPAEVKVAILSTLSKLLEKSGALLRPFLPQLQTTFVKSLNSEDAGVRSTGAIALRKLLVIGNRVDPLINDLSSVAVGEETDPAVILAVLGALDDVLAICGSKATQPVLGKCAAKCETEGLLLNRDAKIRAAASKALCRTLSLVEDATAFLVAAVNRINRLAEQPIDKGNWVEFHTALLLLGSAMRCSPERLAVVPNSADWVLRLVNQGIQYSQDLNAPGLQEASLAAAGAWLASSHADQSNFKAIISVLINGIKSGTLDVKVTSLRMFSLAGLENPDGVASYCGEILPIMYDVAMNSGKEPAKVAANQALVAVTQIRSKPEKIKDFVKAVQPSSTGRAIAEYCRKHLDGVVLTDVKW